MDSFHGVVTYGATDTIMNRPAYPNFSKIKSYIIVLGKARNLSVSIM